MTCIDTVVVSPLHLSFTQKLQEVVDKFNALYSLTLILLCVLYLFRSGFCFLALVTDKYNDCPIVRPPVYLFRSPLYLLQCPLIIFFWGNDAFTTWLPTFVYSSTICCYCWNFHLNCSKNLNYFLWESQIKGDEDTFYSLQF